jgi:hypothetical protein
MFNINEFYGKKIAIRCETFEERDEFYRIMQEEYPRLMRNWRLPLGRKPLEYCYVAGFNGDDQLKCFSCAESARKYGCDVITYKEICGSAWNISPLSELLNDVQ